MTLTDSSICRVHPPLHRAHSALALTSTQLPECECAAWEPPACLDWRQMNEPVREGPVKAARMSWDSTCALVNVALVPQNAQGLGTRRQRR